MRLRWGTRLATTFAELLDLIPEDALDSPRRSVLPLVDFCREPGNALAEIGAAIGFQLSDATDLIFESAVPVQKGSGKSSFTDLLILSENAAVTIESKYTEPEYESVSKWLRTPPKRNRSDVLQGWLDLLSREVGRTMDATAVSDLPYQLIHRAASACFPERKSRAMVYLLFGTPAGHYTKHVASFNNLMGSDNRLSIAVLHAPLRKSSSLIALEEAWDSGQRNLAHSVRASLKTGPLFFFDEIRVLNVP